MKNRTIHQGQSLLVALLPVTSYIVSYFYFVSANIYTNQLSLAFVIALTLYFFRMTNGVEELMYMNRRTGVYWEGYYASPSFFPFLERLNVFFPWGLKKQDELPQEVLRDVININHFHDDRRKQFHVRTNVGPITLSIMQIISNLFGWWWNIKAPKDLGFRLILILLIAGWVANNRYPSPYPRSEAEIFSFFTELMPKPGAVVAQTIPKVVIPISVAPAPLKIEESEVPRSTVVYYIRQGKDPFMPDESWFSIRSDASSPYRVVSEMASKDSRPYVLYPKTINGAVGEILVDQSLCALVPFGAFIKFDTDRPGIHTVNMSQLVTFRWKESELGFWEYFRMKLPHFLGGRTKDELLTHSGGWNYVQSHWNEIDFEKYAILARAMTELEIRAQTLEPHGNGALTCF
jgi:hypothetical protein